MIEGAFRGRRVLVTGVAGFIGRHLVTRLLGEGAAILGLTRRPVEVGVPPLPRGIGLCSADVGDEDAVRAALAGRPLDVVFHLAADTDNSRDPMEPASVLRTNVIGTLNVLRAVEKSGCRMAVVASSAEVYGDAPPPFREDAPRRPLSVYAASKAAAEDVALSYRRSMGWSVAVARIFQPYGPGQRGRYFVPSLLGALAGGVAFDMTAGEQARDFVFIGDVVEALLRIAARPELAGRVLNVGSGVATRLADAAALAVSIVPNAPRPRLGALPYRPVEVMRQQADLAALETALGWKPATPLEWGLRLTLEDLRRERDAARRRATGS